MKIYIQAIMRMSLVVLMIYFGTILITPNYRTLIGILLYGAGISLMCKPFIKYFKKDES